MLQKEVNPFDGKPILSIEDRKDELLRQIDALTLEIESTAKIQQMMSRGRRIVNNLATASAAVMGGITGIWGLGLPVVALGVTLSVLDGLFSLKPDNKGELSVININPTGLNLDEGFKSLLLGAVATPMGGRISDELNDSFTDKDRVLYVLLKLFRFEIVEYCVNNTMNSEAVYSFLCQISQAIAQDQTNMRLLRAIGLKGVTKSDFMGIVGAVQQHKPVPSLEMSEFSKNLFETMDVEAIAPGKNTGYAPDEKKLSYFEREKAKTAAQQVLQTPMGEAKVVQTHPEDLPNEMPYGKVTPKIPKTSASSHDAEMIKRMQEVETFYRTLKLTWVRSKAFYGGQRSGKTFIVAYLTKELVREQSFPIYLKETGDLVVVKPLIVFHINFFRANNEDSAYWRHATESVSVNLNKLSPEKAQVAIDKAMDILERFTQAGGGAEPENEIANCILVIDEVKMTLSENAAYYEKRENFLKKLAAQIDEVANVGDKQRKTIYTIAPTLVAGGLYKPGCSAVKHLQCAVVGVNPHRSIRVNGSTYTFDETVVAAVGNNYKDLRETAMPDHNFDADRIGYFNKTWSSIETMQSLSDLKCESPVRFSDLNSNETLSQWVDVEGNPHMIRADSDEADTIAEPRPVVVMQKTLKPSAASPINLTKPAVLKTADTSDTTVEICFNNPHSLPHGQSVEVGNYQVNSLIDFVHASVTVFLEKKTARTVSGYQAYMSSMKRFERNFPGYSFRDRELFSNLVRAISSSPNGRFTLDSVTGKISLR